MAQSILTFFSLLACQLKNVQLSAVSEELDRALSQVSQGADAASNIPPSPPLHTKAPLVKELERNIFLLRFMCTTLADSLAEAKTMVESRDDLLYSLKV